MEGDSRLPTDRDRLALSRRKLQRTRRTLKRLETEVNQMLDDRRAAERERKRSA